MSAASYALSGDPPVTGRVDQYYTFRPPGCTCPQGGWGGIYPQYCPIHNPQPIVWPYPPITVTDHTTAPFRFTVEKPRPDGDAMRADDV